MAGVLKASEKLTCFARFEACADEDLPAFVDCSAEKHCQVGVAGVPVEVHENGAITRDCEGRRMDPLSTHGISRADGAVRLRRSTAAAL